MSERLCSGHAKPTPQKGVPGRDSEPMGCLRLENFFPSRWKKPFQSHRKALNSGVLVPFVGKVFSNAPPVIRLCLRRRIV
jgi:hypothetical protein